VRECSWERGRGILIDKWRGCFNWAEGVKVRKGKSYLRKREREKFKLRNGDRVNIRGGGEFN
jgi:hypothetical protein